MVSGWFMDAVSVGLRAWSRTIGLELAGKRAMATGGSVVIRLAVAQDLAAEGGGTITIRRDRARVEREAARISQSFGVRAQSISADVTRKGDIDAARTRSSSTTGICTQLPLSGLLELSFL